MSRPARSSVLSSEGGFYHVLNRVAGFPGWYPFSKEPVRREWLRRLRRSLAMSCIQAAAFTLMGNHFHLIVFVEKFRKLAREELEQFAQLRWGRFWKLRTRLWSEQRWETFNRDLFELKVFMRDFQGPFASWFNRTFRRRGHLWGDRYKSLTLKDFEAMQETLYYIELNPVRAGLVELPEDWKAGSAYLRHSRQDGFLMPLERLFPELRNERRRLRTHYRSEMLHRGINPTRQEHVAIPARLLAGERPRGLRQPGVYLSRLRFFSDGLVLGAAAAIADQLRKLHSAGVYKRRREPVPQLDALFFTLRKQRQN